MTFLVLLGCTGFYCGDLCLERAADFLFVTSVVQLKRRNLMSQWPRLILKDTGKQWLTIRVAFLWTSTLAMLLIDEIQSGKPCET